MRPRIIWQYILIAAAWVITFAALRLPAASLNRFLTWQGDVNTQGLLQWLCSLPAGITRDWNDPLIRGGVGAGGRVAATTFALGDLLWLTAVLLAFLIFLFAPMMVRRQNLWNRTGQTIIRCIAPVLLVLPATLFAPPVWGFPSPRIGMYLLGLSHVLVWIALMLTPAPISAARAFPILTKTQ